MEVQPHLMAVFEQERIQLLNRAGDILVRGCGNPENAVEVCPKGVAEHASAEESKEGEQL